MAKLRAIRDIEPQTIQNLLDAGELVRKDATESIRQGAIRGLGHIASKAGEAPNADTGHLELNIEVRLRASDRTVEVASLAPYSSALEMGTSKMAARPFLRPAMAKNRSKLVLLMVATLEGQIGRVKKY